MWCTECGNKAEQEARFCSNCGTKLNKPAMENHLNENNSVAEVKHEGIINLHKAGDDDFGNYDRMNVNSQVQNKMNSVNNNQHSYESAHMDRHNNMNANYQTNQFEVQNQMRSSNMHNRNSHMDANYNHRQDNREMHLYNEMGRVEYQDRNESMCRHSHEEYGHMNSYSQGFDFDVEKEMNEYHSRGQAGGYSQDLNMQNSSYDSYHGQNQMNGQINGYQNYEMNDYSQSNSYGMHSNMQNRYDNNATMGDKRRVLEELFENYIDQISSVIYLKGTSEKAEKKFNNAIRTYCTGLDDREIQYIVYDNTLFGSAKEGFLMTNKTIYWKNLGEHPHKVALRDIRSFTFNNGKLFVNGKEIGLETVTDTVFYEFEQFISRAIKIFGEFN